MPDKFDIEKIIDEIPKDIKDKSKIDENLEAMKKATKVEEKEKLLNDIKNEIETLKQDTGISTSDKEKLEEVETEIKSFQSQLKKLKSKIAWNKQAQKIFEVSSNMEDNGLFWKNDKWIWSWFKSIIQWFDSFFSTAGSDDKIAKTFEKLWYWKDEKIIEKVLKVVRKIPLDKLEEKIKDLDFKKLETKNDDDSLWDKVLKLPIVKRLPDFVNEHLWNDEKITTLEEKKVALRILKTVALNKGIIKSDSNSSWWFVAGIENTIKSTVDSKLWLSNNTWKPTVWTVLDKMFDHGISDNLRDYALPAKGVKLINYGNLDIGSENSKIKNIKAKQISPTVMQFTTVSKVDNSKWDKTDNSKWKEKIKPKSTAEIKIKWTNVYITKWGKTYEFVSWTWSERGISWTITKDDISQISLQNGNLVFSGRIKTTWFSPITFKNKRITQDNLKSVISELSPTNTSITIDGKTVNFKIVN